MFYYILELEIKMVREVIKLSFLLIILIHLQAGTYNFLHATTTTKLKKEIESKGFSTHLSLHTRLSNDSWPSIKVHQENNNLILEDKVEDELMEIVTKMNPKQIIMFEKQLLKLFGMREIPVRDANKTPIIPKYLAQLYDSQLDSEIPSSNLYLPGKFTRTANTIRSFYQSDTDEPDLAHLHAHLKFNLISIPENEQITGAEIRIPFKWENENPVDNLGRQTIQILIHDVVKIPKQTISHEISTLKEPITYPLDSKTVKSSKLNSTFWLTFDVFPAVSRWASLNRKRTLSLAIEMIGKQGSDKLPQILFNKNEFRTKRSLDSISPFTWESASRPAPMLLTYSDDGHNQKKSRDAKTLSRNYRSFQNQRRRRNHRHKNRKRNLCSRKRMFVDFTDVGWDHWVLAPPGYQAFYCSGECPFPMAEHLNATNHAVIQALVNSMNPRLVPPPCCVPNKYSSLSLLYTDSSDRIVLKNYNEMIVDSCGCN